MARSKKKKTPGTPGSSPARPEAARPSTPPSYQRGLPSAANSGGDDEDEEDDKPVAAKPAFVPVPSPLALPKAKPPVEIVEVEEEEEIEEEVEELEEEMEEAEEEEEEEEVAPPPPPKPAPVVERPRSVERPAAPGAERRLPRYARLARPGRPAEGGAPAWGESRRRRDEAPAEKPASRQRIILEDPLAQDEHQHGIGEWLSSVLSFRVGGSSRPSLQTLASFTRKLSALIQTGIPLVRALKLLADRTPHQDLRAATAAVARDVEGGTRLTEAMQRHPKQFPPLMISVVRIGELGGILEESLRRLSDILERKARVRKLVRAAASYPLMLVTLSVLVVGVIMYTIVPLFQDTFRQSGVELPQVTLFIIAISDHIQAMWFLDLVVLIALFFALRFYISVSPTGRRQWEMLLLRLPLIGPIRRLLNSAQFCRTLGGLLASGIPLTESLGVAGDSSESVLVSDAALRVRDAVDQGGKLETNLRAAGCFMPEMLDVVGIGEETGTLDKMMLSLADNYEEEVQARLAALVELIQPVLLFFVGGCIIVILLAVYLPYFQLVNAVGTTNPN